MAKCKYDAEAFPILVEGYAREGLIEKDIARKLGISETTFGDYKRKYPLFLEALKRGKSPVDFDVTNDLLKRCHGYNYDEVTEEIKTDGAGNITMKHKKKTTKHMPPDVMAIQVWLYNRKNNKWKRNPDIIDQNKDNEVIDIRFEEVETDDEA